MHLNSLKQNSVTTVTADDHKSLKMFFCYQKRDKVHAKNPECFKVHQTFGVSSLVGTSFFSFIGSFSTTGVSGSTFSSDLSEIGGRSPFFSFLFFLSFFSFFFDSFGLLTGLSFSSKSASAYKTSNPQLIIN